MKKILAGAAIFIAGIACGLMLTYAPLQAQGSMSEGDVASKLNAVLKGQEDVIAAIDSMKEDVRIIKIRVTQSQ